LACSDIELTSETMNPFRHFGRLPWMGDEPTARPQSTQDRTGQHSTERLKTHIHTSSMIETYDPSVWLVQDHILLRPSSHLDWPVIIRMFKKYNILSEILHLEQYLPPLWWYITIYFDSSCYCHSL